MRREHLYPFSLIIAGIVMIVMAIAFYFLPPAL